MHQLPFPLLLFVAILTGSLSFSIVRVEAEESKLWGNWILAEDIDRIMTGIAEAGLEVGDAAPNEEVITAKTGEAVSMATLWEKRPAVLFFGSASCAFNIEYAAAVNALHEKFGKVADFAWIYLREAHSDGIARPNPAEMEMLSDKSEVEKRRRDQANQFQLATRLPFSVFSDRFGDPAAKSYAAWPTRIYVILPDGKVGFAGGVGPWGFRPLRITPNLEPEYSDAKPFVPLRHQRPNLESYLERLFRKEFPVQDAYSGVPVLTSRKAQGLITSRMENVPLVGEPAIDLELVGSDSGKNVLLSSYWNEKPLVVSMGSFSAEEFKSASRELRLLHGEFADRYQFLHVYLRESSGLSVGGDSVDLQSRRRMAIRWAKESKIPYPVVVDTMDDVAAIHYSAWPSRLVVIGRDGRIRFRGYQGPWGFKVSEESRFAAPEWIYPLAVRHKDVISLEKFLRTDSRRN